MLCAECRGTGEHNGDVRPPCIECQGQGFTLALEQTAEKIAPVWSLCEACTGIGNVSRRLCLTCAGMCIQQKEAYGVLHLYQEEAEVKELVAGRAVHCFLPLSKLVSVESPTLLLPREGHQQPQLPPGDVTITVSLEQTLGTLPIFIRTREERKRSETILGPDDEEDGAETKREHKAVGRFTSFRPLPVRWRDADVWGSIVLSRETDADWLTGGFEVRLPESVVAQPVVSGPVARRSAAAATASATTAPTAYTRLILTDAQRLALATDGFIWYPLPEKGLWCEDDRRTRGFCHLLIQYL